MRYRQRSPRFGARPSHGRGTRPSVVDIAKSVFQVHVVMREATVGHHAGGKASDSSRVRILPICRLTSFVSKPAARRISGSASSSIGACTPFALDAADLCRRPMWSGVDDAVDAAAIVEAVTASIVCGLSDRDRRATTPATVAPGPATADPPADPRLVDRTFALAFRGSAGGAGGRERRASAGYSRTACVGERLPAQRELCGSPGRSVTQLHSCTRSK